MFLVGMFMTMRYSAHALCYFVKMQLFFIFVFFLRTNLQEHKNLFSSNIVYLDSYPAIFLYRIDLVSNF